MTVYFGIFHDKNFLSDKKIFLRFPVLTGQTVTGE